MARRATNIRRLRSLLLVALVLAVAAVAGLYLFGRAGKRTGQRPAEVETKAAKGVTLIGEDFDYTFTEKQRPIFRIKGDSIRADREGTIFLDGVGVTFYDLQGNPYHVESKQASFNRSSNEGLLQGDVVLKGPSQLELRTTQLQIAENGSVLTCPQPVEVRYVGQYVVNGDTLRVNLPDEVFVLEGKARVASLPGAEQPVAGKAERAIYERHRKLLRIEGGAQLSRGTQHLQAQRISAYLSDDEASLVFVRGMWDVAGQSAGPKAADGSSTVVHFSGTDLAVMLQPQGNQLREVDLEGSAQSHAMFETVGGGIQRTLHALRLEGSLEQGVLSHAEAFGGVDIREALRNQRTADGKPYVREAHGQHADASFRPDGHLAAATLVDQVTFQDPQVTAAGNRAEVSFDDNRGTLFGTPVTAQSPKGKLNAPRIVYDTARQIMHAQGGVRAVLEQAADSALAGSPLGEGEGPVHVESKEAFWRQAPSSFVFRGDVRAWRGENLLLGEELLGDKEQDRLTATGGVKTLWIPTDQAPDTAEKTAKPAKAAGAAGAKSEVKRSPIQVVASEMVYQQGARLLTYTGAVRVEQEGKTLNCQKLDVQMNEKKKPERMTCSGQAKLNDPKAGRTIEGSTAVYLLDKKQVEFTGDKVTMRDKEGNQVQGRRVLYSIEDGKVQVQGKEEAKPAGVAAGTTGAGG
jgi:LPS export ABC transporter protein LptC/lipopolysaccharide transport protein LptA